MLARRTRTLPSSLSSTSRRGPAPLRPRAAVSVCCNSAATATDALARLSPPFASARLVACDERRASAGGTKRIASKSATTPADATTSNHDHGRASTGSAMPAAAANSGLEWTTVIQSSPVASGSSAVSNVSGWPRGSRTAAGSALATAISASVMDTSSGCGCSAKASASLRFTAASLAAAPTMSRAPSSPTGAKPPGSTRCSNAALRRHGRQSPPSTTRRSRPEPPVVGRSRQAAAASGRLRTGITRLSRPPSSQARLASAEWMAAAMSTQATGVPPQDTANLCTMTVRQVADVDLAQVVIVCSSRPPTMR